MSWAIIDRKIAPLRSPLDRPIIFTHFRNLAADNKRERTIRFRDLPELIGQTVAPTKKGLPLLSFARYGDLRTDNGSLRHDANVPVITGVSGDHDAGTQTLEEAERLLQNAGIAAVLHTTASHTPQKPRWRVFCPLSDELAPEDYKPLVARLNGILGGTLKGESFTLSQPYYYGHVRGSAYQTAGVDGRAIDEATELDGGAMYPARERDATRSGDAARLAYRIKVVDRGTFEDFCNAVDADSELSQWRYENERKYGNDRQMWRAWGLIKAPDEYDDIFDVWRSGRRFQLTRFVDIKLSTQRRYIVRGLIPREGLVVVWGPPKCGKSFWITDIGLHVALGREYRGRRVKPGAVIYVACEGQAGVPQRIEAFKKTRLAENPEADPPFFLLPTQLNLVAEVKKLIEEIRAQLGDETPIMIVLDTLNRSLAGSENAPEDMTAYINAAEQIREAFNCAVVIVHHCGIDGTRPRGHSSLTGAVDAQIAIRRDGGATVAKIEFMKDGEEGDEIASRLIPVVVGTDEDGEEITSCVVEETDFQADKALSPAKRAAVDILVKLCEASRDGWATDSEWREASIRSSLVTIATKDAVKAAAFRRIYHDLLNGGIILFDDGRVKLDDGL